MFVWDTDEANLGGSQASLSPYSMFMILETNIL